MKRIINKIILLGVVVIALACKDESLDPFRFTELKNGSLLALRGDDGSAGSLNPDQNFFFKDNVQASDKFHYLADFISEDQSLLQSIQVYGKIGNGARTLITTIDASGWTIPTGGNSKQGEVSVPLSTIVSAMALDVTMLDRTDLIIESDILLTDGTTVPATAIVNSGLYSAAAFFPAHTLNYYAEETADFVPVASTSLASGVALKSGAKDTLFVEFDQDLTTTPIISYNNASVTGAGVVKVADDEFYEVITAGAGFTGAVTATVSGGKADTFGPTLTMDNKKQTINVDNTAPQITSLSTGTRVGRGQLATITIKFNEKMSSKSANAIKVSIDDPNDKIKDVDFAGTPFPASMTLASDGLSVSYIFLVEEIAANTAVHGNLDVTFTGGADAAGNAIAGGIADQTLTLDVGTPPAPSLSPDAGGHDLGTQVKWSGQQNDGGANTGGAVQGTIYFVAIDAGSAAPTAIEFDQDANAIWIMASGVTERATGKLFTGASGSTGTTFTTFNANGTFDIYAVFVGTTGNASAIPGAPTIAGLVMN